MRRYLLFALIAFPALELWVLIQVGKSVGALATVFLVILSTMVGLSLLRLKGFHIARGMQAELAAGRLPSDPIIDTFCLMLAGFLFVFPGFVSDALAVLLLLPPVRRVLLAFMVRRMKTDGFQARTVHFTANGDYTDTTWTTVDPEPPTGNGRPQPPGTVIIDCDPEASGQESRPDALPGGRRDS